MNTEYEVNVDSLRTTTLSIGTLRMHCETRRRHENTLYEMHHYVLRSNEGVYYNELMH